MDQKLLKDWIFGLRSGRYTPMEKSSKFYDPENDNCGCGVGVLGKITKSETRTLQFLCGYADIRDKKDYINKLKAETILNKVGLNQDQLKTISESFEGGATFEEIADYLETFLTPENIKIEDSSRLPINS